MLTNLVHVIQVQSAGLLTEFGQNSFKFRHRTFQEYLAAKNVVYFKGVERNEISMFENISSKMSHPNWRIPLSMALGILSKSLEQSPVFDNILARLIKYEQSDANTDAKSSSHLMPFVVIDCMRDLAFASKDKESQLVVSLTAVLFMDYTNLGGFARFPQHRELIENYFLKLKESHANLVGAWLDEKMHANAESIAPCANLIFKLKWYSPRFHEIFLKNVHNDSRAFTWPVDSVLRLVRVVKVFCCKFYL